MLHRNFVVHHPDTPMTTPRYSPKTQQTLLRQNLDKLQPLQETPLHTSFWHPPDILQKPITTFLLYWDTVVRKFLSSVLCPCNVFYSSWKCPWKPPAKITNRNSMLHAFSFRHIPKPLLPAHNLSYFSPNYQKAPINFPDAFLWY